MKKTLPVALLALAITTAVALPARGANPAPSGPVGVGNGAFHAQCAYSHSLKDDPIVFPNGPGASHLHDFFGSTSTDAMSTNESIQLSATSCVRYASSSPYADQSAYWVPSLYVADTLVDPIETGVYYKTGIRHMQSIKPYPKGFRMIAGTSSGAPQMHFSGERIWAYLCPGGVLQAQTSTTAPTCKTNEINVSIRFPDCWDGFSLDSSDHKKHAAYSRKAIGATVRTCPPTHPVATPWLEMITRYPTSGGPTLKLSSGAINTAHADFMNGWDQAKQVALVKNCLNVDKYCGGADEPVPGH